MDLSSMTILCLNMLITICAAYPSRFVIHFGSIDYFIKNSDTEGAIVRPIARCKRALCEANVFPHLVQVVLCRSVNSSLYTLTLAIFDIRRANCREDGHSALWNPSSSVFVPIFRDTQRLKDNIMLPRLYLTGAFYFILMYTGSNVLPIAQFESPNILI